MKKTLGWELGISLGLGFALSRIVRIAITTGQSMEPTVKNKQLVLISCLEKPRVGDLIAFKSRQKKGPKIYLKRVIATGGDRVRIAYRQLYINGQLIKEPYLKEPMKYMPLAEIEVPNKHVFVMGDNRNNSLDSRKLGPIPLKDVIGVVKFANRG